MTKLEAHVRKLVEYSWDSEQRHFEELYLDDEFNIETHKFTKEQKGHIFYNLVHIRKVLQK